MFRFIETAGEPGYSTYRIRYDGQQIGFARYPRNRSEARRLGVRWHWSWSTDQVRWTEANWSSRTAAAEELATFLGLASFPLRTQAATPRRRRTGVTYMQSGSAAGRAFGVEMELTGPSAGVIIRALRDAGISMAQSNLNRMRELSYGSTNTEQHVWTLKHDGSVSGRGLELVSPKLRGESGFNELATVCEVLRAVGASVDRSCGLHVHHDFRNLTADQVKRQVLAFVDRESVIMGLVAPSRRNGHTYTPRWDRDPRNRERLVNVTQLSELSYGLGPRGTINLGAYGAHGSVEIRAHAGTASAKKIAAWVRFGQALFASAEAGDSVNLDSAEQMLADLMPYGLTAEDAAVLLRFQSAGEDRASVEARVLQLRQQIEAAELVLEEVS